MRELRKPFLAAALAAAAFGAVQTATADDQPAKEFIVLYEKGASIKDARAAVKDAGGEIVRENAEIGVATVRSSESDFRAEAAAEKALVGAAANRPIGKGKPAPKPEIKGDQGK